MKKIISIILAAFLCFSCSFAAFSVDKMSVGAEKAKLIMDDTILIPVEIKNNRGIMGFKFSLSYPTEKIKIISVSRGTLTKSGNFNTNFGITEGTFDILWNEVSDVTDDGSLFIIGVKALTYFDEAEIKISFSQDDTFNEKWENVKPDCHRINISCKKEEQKVLQTTSVSNSYENKKNVANVPSVTISDEQILDSINITLEQKNIKSFDEIDSKKRDDFLCSLNENYNKMSGNETSLFNNLQDVKRYYKNAFESNYIQKISNLIDGSDIKAAVEDAFLFVKADDFSSINEKNVSKFLKRVNKNIKSLNGNAPELSSEIDSATSLTTVKKIYGSLEITPVNEKAEFKSGYSKVIIIASVAGTTALIVFAFILVRKKVKK